MTDINELTLREKICQTVIINDPEKLFKQYGGYIEFFKKYPVGGIYLGGSIVGGRMPGTEETFWADEKWKEVLKIKPILCGDFENGQGNPHLMALGATDDDELSYECGKEMGKIYRQWGLHWMFAPVADVVMSNVAPINIRALGDDPERIKVLLENQIKGIASEKILATAKHFPGMGREIADSHLTRVEVGLTKEEWDKTYRVIYKHLIDNGLQAVMSAHISLPAYQKERDEYGMSPIATVSKELLTDLLKDDLGFEGVVVTDGLIMGGTEGNSAEFAVEALRAGNDMLLWPDMKYVELLEEKILNGEFPMSRLDDAVRRIMKIKEFAGVNEKYIPSPEVKPNVGKKIAEKSITLLNNRNNLIPVDKSKINKVLLVVAAKDKTSREKLDYLKTVLEGYKKEVILVHDLWIPELKEHEKDADLTIFAIYEGPSATPGPIMINGRNGESVWASQAADTSKTIVAGFGSPYIYSEYYKHYKTYLNCYSFSELSCEAFVKAIFGEIDCEGKSPVKL